MDGVRLTYGEVRAAMLAALALVEKVGIVWISLNISSTTARRWHYQPDCYQKGGERVPTTREAAEAAGVTACSRCGKGGAKA